MNKTKLYKCINILISHIKKLEFDVSKIEDSRKRFANDKLINDYLTDSINDIKQQIKQTREALDIVLKMRLDLENGSEGIHKDIG